MSATLPAGPVYPTCGEPGCRCGDEAHQRVLREMQAQARVAARRPLPASFYERAERARQAQARTDAEIAAHNRRVALEQAALSAFTVAADERTWTREVGR